jgi:nucleotide-binding universal stress UspA family protein
MKTLLAPAGNNPTAALGPALALARKLTAHIECCYVTPGALQLAVLAMPHDQLRRTAGEMLAERWQALQKETAANAHKAHRAFEAFCRRNGVAIADEPPHAKSVSAEWIETQGNLIDGIVQRAWFNDVAVLSRAAHAGYPTEHLAGEILLRTGRPVFLSAARQPKDSLASIVIAWKAAPQTIRAVTSLLPLLRKAKDVTLATVLEGGMDAEQVRSSAAGFAASLRWHGVACEAHVLESGGDNVYDALLSEVAARKAGLLAMGAYGHSRTREIILGGLTRQMLKAAPVDLFLAH